MFKRMLLALLALGLGGLLAAAPAGAATSPTGMVYVVHGIPGVTVDVYVNGAKTLSNFTPGTVAGPLTLPAGGYSVKVFAAGADPATATPVINTSVQLPAGADVSLVANLDAAGSPVLTPFVNDLSAAPAGDGRLIVRHTAAAPAVDVLAGGAPVFTDLSNGKGAQANLPAGNVSASVVATGTTIPVLIGPATVPVTAGMATVVYAVGAPASGTKASTLGVVTQQIALAGVPMTVQAGTSGLLDRSQGMGGWALALLLAGVIGAAFAGGSLARALVRARG